MIVMIHQWQQNYSALIIRKSAILLIWLQNVKVGFFLRNTFKHSEYVFTVYELSLSEKCTQISKNMPAIGSLIREIAVQI